MSFGAAHGDRESGVIGSRLDPFSADRTGGVASRHQPAASITPPRQTTCGTCHGHGTVLGAGRVQRLIACSGCNGSGRILDPNPPAPAQEPIMARPKKQQTEFEDQGGITGEYKRADAAKAFDIYDKQIKPKLAVIDTKRGECSQPWSDIKEHANFPRPVMNFIIMLDNIDDDQKRDHFLLALRDGLRTRKHFLPSDLVTLSDGDAGGDPIPTGERPRPFLAAVGTTDLNEAIGFTEADEDELAQQTGRPSVEKAKAKAEAAAEEANPKPGTGAAAIAAMKKQAETADKS